MCVRKLLRSEKTTISSIGYDANAIKIIINEDKNSSRNVYFYLYSPWRIIKNNLIINSSGLYPYEEHYDSKEEYLKEFRKYCNSTKRLMKTKIKEIKFKKDSNDLEIKWEDGTILEKFCLESKEFAYHIYDNFNYMEYEYSYNKTKKYKYTKEEKKS